MFKSNNRNTRTRCEIYSKLTIKKSERRQCYSGVSIVNSENISRKTFLSIVNFEHVIARWEPFEYFQNLKYVNI